MVRAGNWSWGISGLFAQICHWLLDYLTVLWVCLFYFSRNKKCNNQNIKKTRRFDSVQHDLQGHVPGQVRRPSVHVGLSLYPFYYLSLLFTGYNSAFPGADALSDCIPCRCRIEVSVLAMNDTSLTIHTGQVTRLLWETPGSVLTSWRCFWWLR